jgi:hypothetical protein
MDSLLPFLQGLAPLQHAGLARRTPVRRLFRHNAVDGYQFTRNAGAAYDLRMLPSKPGFLLLLTALSISSAGFLCHAQQAQPTAAIRYHFGDDRDGKLGWANPDFDDSAWIQPKDGRIPSPPAAPGGFLWTRQRIAVQQDASGSSSIRVIQKAFGPFSFILCSSEMYVNGRRVGRRGSFPPNVEPVATNTGSVFDLPPNLVRPGTVAVVAYREWYQPDMRWPGTAHSTTFELGDSSRLRFEDHTEHLTSPLV